MILNRAADCVGVVPLIATEPTAVNGSQASTYTGVVDFENVFKGLLPASEYPKVAVRQSLGCKPL